MTETIRVFGKVDCPWCVKVKSLLMDKGYTFSYIDIEQYPHARWFLKMQDLNTVPQVFSGYTRIGGFEDTANWINEKAEPTLF